MQGAANEAAVGEWWKTFHMPEMADLFLDARTPEVVRETTEFLIRALQLQSGDHVFDQCCGSGCLAMALAREGMELTGADLCEAYIERAKSTTATGEYEYPNVRRPEFYCADAFDFLPSKPCLGVFNWYSSFGYSSDDDRNQSMLQRAYDALRPSGRFALDVLNLTFVLRTFRANMSHKGVSEGRRVLLNRQSEISLPEGLLKQTWTWEVEGMPPIERHSAVRLYLPHQIQRMLVDCGFQEIQLFGDLQFSPLQLDSPRLIITAQRPNDERFYA